MLFLSETFHGWLDQSGSVWMDRSQNAFHRHLGKNPCPRWDEQHQPRSCCASTFDQTVWNKFFDVRMCGGVVRLRTTDCARLVWDCVFPLTSAAERRPQSHSQWGNLPWRGVVLLLVWASQIRRRLSTALGVSRLCCATFGQIWSISWAWWSTATPRIIAEFPMIPALLLFLLLVAIGTVSVASLEQGIDSREISRGDGRR